MHELSIARSVVDQVATLAREHGFEGVSSVRLQIGELCGVIEGSLEFAFELAAEGTILEGARLDMERVPVTLWCTTCSEVVEPLEQAFFVCPSCGHPSADLVSGRDLIISGFVGEESGAVLA